MLDFEKGIGGCLETVQGKALKRKGIICKKL